MNQTTCWESQYMNIIMQWTVIPFVQLINVVSIFFYFLYVKMEVVPIAIIIELN